MMNSLLMRHVYTYVEVSGTSESIKDATIWTSWLFGDLKVIVPIIGAGVILIVIIIMIVVVRYLKISTR